MAAGSQVPHITIFEANFVQELEPKIQKAYVESAPDLSIQVQKPSACAHCNHHDSCILLVQVPVR